METEDLLNKKNIHFLYSGADLLVKCLNPEHDDSNPSMRIDKITGIFNCLSCGYAGNIFKLFNEDYNILDIKVQRIKDKIKKLTVPTLTIPLDAVPFAKDYRGISAETFKRFKAYTTSDKDYEGRIVFPIWDILDKIVLFHARYIHSDVSPKYINLPHGVKKPLFPAAPDEIYSGSIILVEGFFDMLNLWDKGLKNAVCAFSSTLTKKSGKSDADVVRKFSQYKLQGVNKIYIMFDGDKAGRDGAIKLQKALRENYIIEIIELDEDNDPGNLTINDVNNIKEYYYG